MFRKSKEASAIPLTSGLPQERKALAERYTIDAREAESRADQAAEDQRRREAEFQARRAAALQARREIAEPAQPVAPERRHAADEAPALREPVPEPPAPVQAVTTASSPAGAFPIYGWTQQATAPPDTKADWTRTLLRTAVEEQREKASRA